MILLSLLAGRTVSLCSPLLLYFVCAISEGSRKTVWIHSLARTVTGCLLIKFHFYTKKVKSILSSLFFSFSMLWGPMNHVKHLFSMQRLPFTSAYFGTLFATIYCSIWVSVNREFLNMLDIFYALQSFPF